MALKLAKDPGKLLVCSFGQELVRYDWAVSLQERVANRVASGSLSNVLLCLQHTPVFTLGKRGTSAHVLKSETEIAAQGAEVHRSSRGGEVTFHGPGQLVVYPIFGVRRMRLFPHRFVEALESSMIGTAGAWGLQARGNIPKRTGVWIGDRKIGAVGLRFSSGVSMHGIAFNVSPDVSWYDMIVPCGQPAHLTVTSLEKEIQRPVDIGVVEGQLLEHIAHALPHSAVDTISPDRLQELLSETL